MKTNFSKLLEFVGKAVDFAALLCATNLSKTLVKLGYKHVESLK